MGKLAHSNRKYNPKCAVLHAVCAFWVSWGYGQACALGPPIAFTQTLAAGEGPIAIAVTELNRDGTPDLCVANNEEATISVLLGRGRGAFATAFAVPTGDGPTGLASGDFDRDNFFDVAVAEGFADTVGVFRTRRAGAMDRVATLVTGAAPAGIACADLDGDGRLDLVTANSFDGTVSVFLGTGTSFAPLGDFVTGRDADSGPVGLTIGDFNGDRIPDLAVVNKLEDSVSVLEGDGAGSFPVTWTVEVASSPSAVRVGDVTGDGHADLVIASEGDDEVVILSGDGTGGVGERIALETGGLPESIALADFNGDRLVDIATADSFSDVVSVFAALGHGAFAARAVFPVGRSPFDLTVGDLNGDGRPDIAAANFDDGNVTVLLNTTPFAVLPGDVDGDAVLSLQDLAALLGELFDGDGDLAAMAARGLVAAWPGVDGARDGFVTAADVVALLRQARQSLRGGPSSSARRGTPLQHEARARLAAY